MTEVFAELQAIRTRASDLQARLLDSDDPVVVSHLSTELAQLFERHCQLMSRLQG